MRTGSARKSAADAVGTLVTALAIVISILVATALVLVDTQSVQQVRDTRLRATLVPAAGKLAGESAVDASEWSPAEKPKRLAVLFGIAEPGQAGDMEFWRDIASRTHAGAPETQFVGLCISGKSCGSPTAADGPLVLLKSMDPAQTHALATSARQGRAFLFLGSRMQGEFSIGRDRQAFAAQVVTLSHQKAREGGA